MPASTPPSSTTEAERHGDHYVVNGKKIWTSTAQVADKMLLLARTTPHDKVQAQTDGLTLFYTDLDRSPSRGAQIDKMGRKAVDTNQVFFEASRSRSRTASARKARASAYSCTG